MDAFDVITMGRIGVDVYPLQTGVSLREVESFGKFLGGSPTNIAVAAARYGRRTAVITRTGEVAQALVRFPANQYSERDGSEQRLVRQGGHPPLARGGAGPGPSRRAYALPDGGVR
jgi:sugar/nucleoside kinase (ribokinase family)